MKSLIALMENKKIIESMNFITLCFVFLFSNNVFSAESLMEYTNKKWKLNKTQMKYLKNHEILADSEVNTKDNVQSFKLKSMAMHPKKCSRVLRKLSRLEEFSSWISFIKKSTYNDKNKLFSLRADHTLLPYPMIIHIIVDRPTKMGTYPFTFPTGLFTGLKGHFEIKEFDNKCFFYATSFWSGAKTKLPDFAIELFSETLTKVGGGILMRKIR